MLFSNYKLTVFRNAMTENIMYPIRYFMDKSDKQTISGILFTMSNVKCSVIILNMILFKKKRGYNENGIKQCHVKNAFFSLFLSMFFFLINIYFFIYMCIYTRMLTCHWLRGTLNTCMVLRGIFCHSSNNALPSSCKF